MALNSTHFFDVYPISLKSNRVAHPDSGMLGGNTVLSYLFIQYERQSEKQEVEELLDRVDTDLKDIRGALAKSAVSGACVCVS